jgi:PKHD-type hydroxylase
MTRKYKPVLEPVWKSWIIKSNAAVLTPEQCKIVMDTGRSLQPEKAKIGMGSDGKRDDAKSRVTTISWIPFDKLPELYDTLDTFIQKANGNHFGFEDIRITESAQYTEYPPGGFYEWHMDTDVVGKHEPPVRKISMTLLLNDPSEFEGGDLELIEENKTAPIQQGHAVCFASFLRHRVKPVTQGIRKSLVVWFGGAPFK